MGFAPTNNYGGGSPPSGVTLGVATGTTTIYTNILEVARMDNQGLELAWTGTPTGTITIYGSNSGINWFSITFNPAYANPAGSAGVEGISLNQFPWKYLMLSYTNASGTGTIACYAQFKDLN